MYMNANICSNDSGSLCRRTSKKACMPWRHILAGIEYLAANLLNAGLAEGCCDAKKKSWCSWSNCTIFVISD